MRKIIRGKKYDTETATEVGYWENMEYQRNFHYCAESLYRKTTGEFFLHGEGGALSKYAHRVLVSFSSGDEIIPLSIHDAKRWAEAHMDSDRYEEVFGPIPE